MPKHTGQSVRDQPDHTPVATGPHPVGYDDAVTARERTPTRSGQRAPSGAAWAGAVVLAALAGAVLSADVLGLDDRTPLVQVIAFRPAIAAGLVVGALLLAAGGRGARPAAVALGLVGLLGLAAVVPRAVADPAPDGSADGDTLTVLTLNTFVGRVDVDDLAALVRDRSPDLVALPEAGAALRDRLRSRLAGDDGPGYRSAVAQDAEDASPMTVLVRGDLGHTTVTEDRRGAYPSVVVDLPRVRFVAVHPQAPKPGDTRQWVRDVADVARWCTGSRPTIVAGDLNATRDHRELRDATASCTDAAPSVGEGLVGTWPAGLPRLLGAQIDHVLTTGGPRPTAAEVLDVAGTDHRALLVTVRL